MYRLPLDLLYMQHQQRHTEDMIQDGEQIARVSLSLPLLSLSPCPATTKERNDTTTKKIDTKHKGMA